MILSTLILFHILYIVIYIFILNKRLNTYQNYSERYRFRLIHNLVVLKYFEILTLPKT